MRMRSWAPAALVAATLLVPAGSHAASYKIDESHTSVGFRVRHLFTSVEGRFKEFGGTIEFDPEKPEEAKVQGTIETKTIDTNVADRDEHLRSPDFFNVAEHPQIKFESTKVSDVSADKKTGKVHGNLTIHGVTKPVVLDAEFHGVGADPWGNKKAGFSARTTIDRRDYGLTWNKALEAGNVLVGNDVEVRLDVEANAIEAEE